MNNRLICDAEFSTENEGLIDERLYLCGSMIADELQVDTLKATVVDRWMQGIPLTAADGLITAGGALMIDERAARAGVASCAHGTPVYAFHGDMQLGKFYLNKCVRVGKNLYELQCVSGIGLLTGTKHYGGVYTGQTFAEVAADIIGGIVPYTIDDDAARTPVFGWLPIAERRENLHSLLFACGAFIEKDAFGEIHIIYPTAQQPAALADERLYLGGSVDRGSVATGVDTTEHSFFATENDTIETLFDGEVAAEQIDTPKGAHVFGAIVTFSDPYHDLRAENGTILESGANYAVLAQSPSCVLTGRKYTHTTRLVSRRTAADSAPNIIPVDKAYLVNTANSENVADRLMRYYASPKLVSTDIVLEDERPGGCVRFHDPFGEMTDGYIRDMDITVSGILRASCTVVAGYTPGSSGNYYEHVLVISTSQTVVIPQECKGKIRAVLIGGGHGGYLGNPGETGEHDWDNLNPSTAGGEPGEPGEGGRVFVITLAASAGQSFPVTIGAGGAGQTVSSDAQEGGATTFASYSSANGLSSSDGYVDVLNNVSYAMSGGRGVAGGHGQSYKNDGTNVIWDGVTYVTGQKGKDAEYGSYDAYGGYGGGPAAGANGGDGQKGRFSGTNHFADGGRGGDGATPIKAPNGTIPGQGGFGGHGGGGGGQGGGARGPSSSEEMYGAAGTPGNGGEGGDGAPGILLIYY